MRDPAPDLQRQSTMRLLFAVLLLAAPLHAGDVELTVLGGKAVPFYEQAITYDPGQLSLPGTTVDQRSDFRLEAQGGLTLSAALAVTLKGPLALEARLDTADVSVPTEGARYRLRTDRPPFPSAATDVDLGDGEVELQRLKPLSLNLRLMGTRGRFRGGISGGASYLPAFRFELEQRLSIDVPILGPLDILRVRLPAEAAPGGEGESRLGANVGATGGWKVADRLTILGDVRWFYFRKQTLEWGTVTSNLPLPSTYAVLIGQIVDGLEPAKFNPAFFHLAIGASVRF